MRPIENIVEPEIHTIFKGTYEYEGKRYTFEYDFGEGYTKDEAEFAFTQGNYSCACNISHFIRSYCDEKFPDLECGTNIELVECEIYKKEFPRNINHNDYVAYHPETSNEEKTLKTYEEVFSTQNESMAEGYPCIAGTKVILLNENTNQIKVDYFIPEILTTDWKVIFSGMTSADNTSVILQNLLAQLGWYK